MVGLWVNDKKKYLLRRDWGDWREWGEGGKKIGGVLLRRSGGHQFC